jgi:hypothetical protein
VFPDFIGLWSLEEFAAEDALPFMGIVQVMSHIVLRLLTAARVCVVPSAQHKTQFFQILDRSLVGAWNINQVAFCRSMMRQRR